MANRHKKQSKKQTVNTSNASMFFVTVLSSPVVAELLHAAVKFMSSS